MKKTQIVWLPLALACCFAFATGAACQSLSHLEAGLNYNYARTNAAPGQCGCFSMQGGNAWASYGLIRSWDVVGEVASQHATNISPFGTDLTITSYMGGVRYKRNMRMRFSPFAQFVAGGAHASGSMAPGNPGIPGSSNSFALAAGGGLDLELSRFSALRVIQADYYYTRFPNGVNNRQNNLRIGAGVLIHFGSR